MRCSCRFCTACLATWVSWRSSQLCPAPPLTRSLRCGNRAADDHTHSHFRNRSYPITGAKSTGSQSATTYDITLTSLLTKLLTPPFSAPSPPSTSDNQIAHIGAKAPEKMLTPKIRDNAQLPFFCPSSLLSFFVSFHFSSFQTCLHPWWSVLSPVSTVRGITKEQTVHKTHH